MHVGQRVRLLAEVACVAPPPPSKAQAILAGQIGTDSQQLLEAEDTIQSARYSGDAQAFGYAEQKSIRLRRELAKIDPLGVGAPYLGNLTATERNAALK